MILFGPDLALVHLVAIVENLNLHALVGGVPLIGRADSDAIVGACRKHELEAENKIAIFLFSKEITAALGRAHDFAVLHDVAGAVAADEFPSLQSLPVE